ncbi:hypothetical protein K443DRAFT_91627, partial [Laccaria amethystina LaAM-08-1]
FKKIREGATTFVSWEKSPKKEVTYPKMEICPLFEATKCPLFEAIKVCSACLFSLQSL